MTSFRGYNACTCLAEWLPVYEKELQRLGVLKGQLRIYQLIGGAAASGGTHSKGGAFDLLDLPGGKDIEIARQMGADATWSRPYNWDNRKGMAHIHGVLTGCPHNGPARYQIDDVKRGLNGLANHGKDTGPRPLSGRTYEQGIAWVKARQKPKTNLRFATFNVPGSDKIPNATARAKAAAALVNNGAAPALVGWNELVGIKGPGRASDFARAIDTVLGSRWLMVKPTKVYNENYISYDKEILQLVKQYDDSILEAKTGGRHLTRAVFKVRKTGFVFAVGQTHLVNGTTAQHKADRQTQAADALASIKAVTAKHGNCPFIIQGDMNTSGYLTALTKAGMKRTRTYADESTTRDDSTYTNIAKDKPSTNPDWAIDQSYASDDFYCVGYAVRRNTKAGEYVKPRASDHDLVVSSVRI